MNLLTTAVGCVLLLSKKLDCDTSFLMVHQNIVDLAVVRALGGGRGNPQVEDHQAKTANEPRLPHAPRRGKRGQKNRERRRCERLSLDRKKRNTQN